MKIKNEYLDEKTNEYVFEVECTDEERTALEEISKEQGFSNINDYICSLLELFVENKEQAKEWIKNNRTDKCKKTPIGQPVLKMGDKVGTYLTIHGNEIFCIGTVEIIDSYGTFEQNEEPSYDIMVNNFNNSGERCLVKHVRQSNCFKLEK